MLNNVELQFKSLRILGRYSFCQDSEFRSTMETSAVDNIYYIFGPWKYEECVVSDSAEKKNYRAASVASVNKNNYHY